MRDAQLHLVLTFEEACEFKRWLGERRPVMAVDTETSGLHWWRDDLRMVQFGDATAGWCIPVGEWTGLAREALRDYEGELVLHNAKFDLHFLRQAGLTINPAAVVHDTQVQAHLLDPTQRVGLKPLADRHLEGAASASQTGLKRAMTLQKWDWGSVPLDFDTYWQYGALDVVLTARLHELQHPQVEADFASIYDIEMACQHVLFEMERRGFRIDVDYCRAKQAELEEYAAEARAWLDEQGVSMGNKRLAAFFQSQGIVLTKRTDSGGWSMDESVLAGIDHPVAETVLRIRKAEKFARSYFRNFLDLADVDLLHPSVRAQGARTGRMSVATPSLQNLPRGDRLIRDAFIAREDHTLLLMDYDQVEMRLMAHFSQDADMIDAFGQEADFFTTLARSLYDDPDLQKDDHRRQLTKNTAYGKAYGGGARTLAETAGVTESEARAFLAKFDSRFPSLTYFMRKVEEAGRRRFAEEGVAYVRTWLGRRQLCEPDAVYRLTNYLIQGTAADLLKQRLVMLDAAGLAEHLVLPVHDEVIFDVPACEADELAAEARKVLEDHDTFAVPLTVGEDTYQRWGLKYA